jgi:hypothetical protein
MAMMATPRRMAHSLKPKTSMPRAIIHIRRMGLEKNQVPSCCPWAFFQRLPHQVEIQSLRSVSMRPTSP